MKNMKGLNCLAFALCAFMGLGLEAVLAFIIEPLVYGRTIYYLFETALVTLIIVFGQKAFEKWFRNEKIPYGGIAAALTWGLAHTLTKGTITAGLLSAMSGFIFGVTYLLVNRDIKKTYLLLFIMFVF